MTVRSPIGQSAAIALALAAGGFVSTAQAHDNPLAHRCGYQVNSGTYTTWPDGYEAWVNVINLTGDVGTDFEIFLDVGDTTITDGYLAEYQQVVDGYMVGAPPWLVDQKIEQGGDGIYQFQFNGAGEYEGVTPYIVSINGEICDHE